MKAFPNVSLVDLLNPKNASDPTLQSIAKGLDLTFQGFLSDCSNLCTLPNIRNITDNATLDYIGLWTLNSPGYNTTLTVAQKQWLIENTIPLKRKRGTKWAIETIVGNLFSTATVRRWYETGGVPGTFDVLIEDLPTDPQQLQNLFDSIYDTKSTRDWFVGFIAFAANMQTPIYAGCAMGIHRYQVITFPTA